MHQMNITSSVIKILSCDIIYRAFRDCETLLPGNDLAVRIRCGNVTVSLYGLGTDTLLFLVVIFGLTRKFCTVRQ